MLNRAILAGGFFFALVSISWGQSQQPSPSDRESRSPQQTQSTAPQQPAYDQRGTEQVPLIVRIIPTQKTKEESDQEAKDREDKSANDRELIRYSRYLDILTAIIIAVGALQLVVFGYQAWALRQTVKTMELTERPHMLVSALNFSGIKTPPDQAGMVKLSIEYKIHNYGRSPAFLKKSSLHFAVAEKLSEPPAYPDTKAVRFIVAVNGWYGSVGPNEAFVDGFSIRNIFTGDGEFFVWGMLEYSGTIPLVHKSRFAYRMIFDDNGNSTQFYPDGPDSYWENT
jgi:hypothetical protein